jgi:acetyl-CoA synthetase
MDAPPAPAAYRDLIDREYSGYEELYRTFEWSVPDSFNLATACCDRWATDADRVAMYARDAAGTDESSTFGELRSQANRLATSLQHHGVERGDRVCVSGSQTATTMIGHLAAWKLGAISVPLSVLLGPEALEYRLGDCDPSAFIVSGETVETLRTLEHDVDHVVVPDEVDPVGREVTYSAAVSDADDSVSTRETAPDDGAIIIYTSGTTGRPKGALLPHQVVLGALPCVILGLFNLELHEGDVGRTAVEWSWAGALVDFVLPLWFFGKPVVGLAHRELDAETEFDLVDTFDVTLYNAPPTALRMLSRAEDPGSRHDLGSLRGLFSGGEAVSRDIFEWAEAVFDEPTLQQGYGQTEAPAFIGDCEALEVPYKQGKLGKPSPGSEVAILDPETGEPTVEQGDVGEIGLRYDGNPGCFRRYWQQPEKTSAKIQDGWLLSEDLGRRTDDGYIVFEGRKDDVIVSAGYKIGPEEIEDVLATHEAVADAGVIAIPDDTRGAIPKAFVTLRQGTTPEDSLADELQSYVRDRLAKYQYPRAIEFIDELPTTTSGKLRRVELREREDGR